MEIKRLYSRFYCPVNERHRVFPNDQFESYTEAPEAGKRGGKILLRSHNTARKDGHQMAWCWSCNRWVEAFKRSQHEIAVMYLSRAGVTFRMPDENVKSSRARALDRLQQAAKRAIKAG